MTPQERALWNMLRLRQMGGYRFRRQHPLGRYVLDFVCLEVGLAIELDGSQHAMSQTSDTICDLWLESKGFRVVRFWNHEVDKSFDGILIRIRLELGIDPGAV